MRNLQRPIDWFYHEYLYVIVRFVGIVHSWSDCACVQLYFVSSRSENKFFCFFFNFSWWYKFKVCYFEKKQTNEKQKKNKK